MNKKGLVSILLNALLVFTVVAGVFIKIPVKADAATGRWVLQSAETVYGNDEYLGTTWTFDHDEIDGQMIYKITSTFTNIDGTFTGLYTTKADIPPGTIRAGERVRLRLSATVQGSMDDGICPNTVYVRMRPYNSDGTKSGATRLYFTKESDGSNDGSSVSVWTGPPSNRQYEDADTIYYDFPEGGYEGEKMSIELEISSGSSSGGVPNGGLTTDWQYVWTTSDENMSYTGEGLPSSGNDGTGTGMWVLQSSETVYGNDEYLGTTWTFDHDEIDGQMIYKITSTFTNIDGTFTGLYTTKADIPPGTIRAGERVRLRLSATVQGSMDDGICPNTVYVRMRPYNSDGTKSGATRLYFTKESDGSNDGSSVSVWTGPPSNRQYEDADTIYYDFPEGGYEGEKMSIELEISSGSSSGGVPNGGLTTDWQYVWMTR